VADSSSSTEYWVCSNSVCTAGSKAALAQVEHLQHPMHMRAPGLESLLLEQHAAGSATLSSQNIHVPFGELCATSTHVTSQPYLHDGF
jgi:hypothetical protein